MLDFTSSLYLDFQHPAYALQDWRQLTTGKPAMLLEPSVSNLLSSQITHLTTSETSLIGVSTLHLYWDVMFWLSQMKVQIYYDQFAYPVSSQLFKCHFSKNRPATRLRHHNSDEFHKMLSRRSTQGLTPVLLADGYCPLSGELFPINDFISIIEKQRGLLILDDTQSLGIFGKQSPHHSSIYGTGGGGVKCWHGIDSPRIILISSLAKAFGVPIAALSASSDIVKSLSEKRFSAMHCSQASNAHLHAALHALKINSRHGNQLRQQLASRVSHFRHSIGSIKERMINTCHPYQTIIIHSSAISFKLIQFLKSHGILGIHHYYVNEYSAVSFIITVAHQYQDLSYLAEIIIYFFNRSNAIIERSHYEPDSHSA